MTILYIHGMGGGEDSRIPSILKERLKDKGVEVIVHTYDFDPEVASGQINTWFDEIRPDMVIGESLGACHALRLHGVPHLFVSPAVNAPEAMALFSYFSGVPILRRAATSIFKVKRENRQQLNFSPSVIRKYKSIVFDSVKNTDDYVFAFFGRRDSFRLSGIVSRFTWRKAFGADSYCLYGGTHYMEEEYIDSLLIPRILSI